MPVKKYRDFIFSADGALLLADIKAWAAWRSIPLETDASIYDCFIDHVKVSAEFRSVVDFRAAKKIGYIYPELKRATDLYIACDSIGGGFKVQHGHSTWIFADSIGDNFMVNQNVTIGVWKNKKPRIGNNVSIRTGAVVTGGIQIGNNVTIAPNAFVNFDVPDDSVVFPPRSVVVTKSR